MSRLFYASASSVGIGTTTPRSTFDIATTDATIIPVGTTAQRPSGIAGMIRFNTTTTSFEGHNGSSWTGIGGGTIQNVLTITDTATINSLLISSSSTLSGPIRINNTLIITGAGTISSLNVSGNTTISGSTVINNTLTITGTATLSSLNVSGATSISGSSIINNTLTVSGSTVINNTLTITGTGTLSSLNVSGNTTISGSTIINNTLTITGTATLSSLNVSTNSNITGASTFGNTLTIAGSTSTSAGLILQTGRLGIGTTTPNLLVDVQGNINGEVSTGVYNQFATGYTAMRLTNDVGTAIIFMNGSKKANDGNENTLSIRNDTGGNVRIQGSASTTGTSFLANGNVGIGTTTPSSLLHLSSNTTVSAIYQDNLATTGYSSIGIRNDALNGLVMFVNGSARTADGGTNTATIRNDNGGLLRVGGSFANTGVAINSSGSVGIGTTTPSATLQVSGATIINSSLTVTGASTFSNTLNIAGAGSTGNSLIVQTGRIGLGTTAPIYNLDVAGNARIGTPNSASFYLDFGYTGTSGIPRSGYIFNGGTDTMFMNEIASGKLFFGTSGLTRLTIDGSGNIGIGTTSPSSLLHLSNNTTASVIYSDNLATTGYSLLSLRNDTSNGLVMFVNGSARTADGGTNTSFIRNDNGGLLRLGGSSANVGVVINSSGRTGIGNTSPISNLDIAFSGSNCTDGIISRNTLVTNNHYTNLSTLGTGTVIGPAVRSDSNNITFIFRNNFGVAGNYYITLGGINYFTGQHLVWSENDSIPITSQLNDFIGLIVSTSGQYKTFGNFNTDILENKDAITINNAHPIIKLTNSRKDKSVFGVITNQEEGPNTINKFDYDRQGQSGFENDDLKGRIRINSVGEGAIWISNTNGNLENGDYIQSSNLIGYGEKQDSEFIANYTVAKITCNVNFSDSNLSDKYQVRYLDSSSNIITNQQYLDNLTNNIPSYIACFVGCTYHCG